MENTKQVIVWRNDLKVRTGKKMAMAAHASMAFLTKDGFVINDWREDYCITEFCNDSYEIGKYQDEINHWLKNSFRKICVYVNSEQELKDLHQKAIDSGLISHMITDNGATEFHGVPTITALAIGPHIDSKFIGLTDHLPLL